jgi:hypothetical protein
LILLGILLPLISKADSWFNPQVKTYYSENKEYKLIITPKGFTLNYHQWQYYKSNRHPQTKEFLQKKEEFLQNILPQDTISNPSCIAELYQINKTDTILLWIKPLLNNYCPIHAIVANNGSSIATFDNWYSIGHGINVFVVYNENGEARRTSKLDEITPYPLNDYMTTITSIYLRKEAKYIDNDMIEIVFATENDLQTKRVYNIRSLEFEK